MPHRDLGWCINVVYLRQGLETYPVSFGYPPKSFFGFNRMINTTGNTARRRFSAQIAWFLLSRSRNVKRSAAHPELKSKRKEEKNSAEYEFRHLPLDQIESFFYRINGV